jgi:predicted metal-dependent hydrolase
MNAPAPPVPLVIAFVADLMFTTRIEKAADHLGYRVEWIESADQIGEIDPFAAPELPGELLHGREGHLFDFIARRQPALLLFDLNNKAIPWRDWIAALKSAAATRRIPVMCFGSHEDVATMSAAKSAGADAVLARSRFTADMPALLQRYARIPDRAALAETCAEPLSPLAREGIERFNRGEYYKAHDSLEEAWMQDQGAGRDLYRGILQVGIAYYQIEQGNYRGAIKMLLRVRQWLEPLPDICRGVDVDQLRANVEAVHDALRALGPGQLGLFDTSTFSKIRLLS